MIRSRLTRCLQGEPLDRPPVWLMRQSGRYIPAYQNLRKHFPDFMSFCLNSEASFKATMIPMTLFPSLDAAIIFSDILTIPWALGYEVQFAGRGPMLTGNADPRTWPSSITERLQPVYEAVHHVHQELPEHQSLLGFCGAPWTLMAYMLGERHVGDFAQSRLQALTYTPRYQAQLAHISDAIIEHATRQFEAGADTIMLFDSWAGLLPEQAFLQSCIQPLHHICRTLKERHIPSIVFLKGAGHWLQHWQGIPADVFSVDAGLDLQLVQSLTKKTVQGNLDPAWLLGSGQDLLYGVEKWLNNCPQNNVILNLGHGLLPMTPVENVHMLLERIEQLKTGG